jgi:DNA-binding transcriptional MerR regulator
MPMKTGDLERKFGVSGTTIRRWTETYKEFLSIEARGHDSRQRTITESDYLVLATINKLSNERASTEEIKTKLREGFRVEVEDIATIGYVDSRLVPAAVVEQVIDASELLEKVQDKLEATEEKLAVVEKESRLREEALRHEKESLEKELRELMLRVGKAEGKLEEIEYNRRLKE